MDILKYLSGMLNYDSKLDYIEEQKFADNGMPIPIGAYRIPVKESIAKSMPVRMRDEEVHEAADIAEQIKAAWLKGASEFMGGNGMLNSNPKSMPELRPEQKENQSIEVAPSEKPGWMMADGTNFWSVNTDDPYWDTEEGYQEALALYGESPAWSTRPVERDNTFTDFVAPKRISL
jgi:hypothetical protein